MTPQWMQIITVIDLAMLGWVIPEQRALRRDVHRDIADLRERMTRLEGLFDGFTKRDRSGQSS